MNLPSRRSPTAVRGAPGSLVLALYLLGGAVLGVGLSLFVVRARDGQRTAEESRAIERRLSAVEGQRNDPIYVQVPVAVREPARDAVAVAEATPPGDEAIPAEPDVARRRDEQREELARHTESAIQKHRLERQDSGWAAKAAPSLRAGLEKVAESRKFKLGEVDCRSTSCLATLEWNNATEAREEFGKLAHEPFDVNCARSISLPGDAEPSMPVQATLILDCTNWKAEGSQFLSAR
jgi:hypothetical protein